MSPIFVSGNLQVHGLAPRQAEALAHTARGLSAKETAQAMNISHRTVEVFLTQAMQRLGARNRVHLITQAISKGALVITEQGRAAILFLALALTLVPTTLEIHDDYGRLIPRPVRVRTTRRNGQRDPQDYLPADA